MLRRRLGSDGPEVSVVGIGTWAIGGPYVFGWGPQDDDESIAAIRRAIDGGVTWIDTAPVYGFGHAEEVVARALNGLTPGEDVLVFSKCGRTWTGDGSGGVGFDLRPASIRAECEAILGRLGIERLDLLQFHWPDPDTGTAIEESWATARALIDEGKVRWAGVSNFDVGLLERCESVAHVTSLQPPVNMIQRTALGDVVPWCDSNGTGVIAYAPMANGMLAGRMDAARVASLAEDDWRRRSPVFTEPHLSRNLDLAGRLRSIASDAGRSPTDLAIGWVLSQPGITCAAVGGRAPAQVDGWLSAGADPLAAEVLAAIDDAIAASGAGLEPPKPTRPSR